jgi:lipopolysaccharide/colanic/teichoic acid biosynthesis glycosyltransferase
MPEHARRGQGAEPTIGPSVLWPIIWSVSTILLSAVPTAFAARKGKDEAFAVLVFSFVVVSSLVLVAERLAGYRNPWQVTLEKYRAWNVTGILVLLITVLTFVGFWSGALLYIFVPAESFSGIVVSSFVLIAGIVVNVLYLTGKERVPKGLHLNRRPVDVDVANHFRSLVVKGWRYDDQPARLEAVRILLEDTVAGSRLLRDLFRSRDAEVADAVDSLVEAIESSQMLQTALDPVRADVDRVEERYSRLLHHLRRDVDDLFQRSAPRQVAKRWLRSQFSLRHAEDEWASLQTRRPLDRAIEFFADRVLSAILLVTLTFILPIVPLVVVAIRIDQRHTQLPTIFKTKRVAKGGGFFDYYRFRLRTGPRGPQTAISQFIFVTGLVKLPALYNVAIGQMNLVGPEPLAIYHYRRMTRHSAGPSLDLLRRLAVKPGFTGPYQVELLNSPMTDYRRFLQLEAQYAATWTLLDDSRIVFRRLATLLRQLRQALSREYRESVLKKAGFYDTADPGANLTQTA